MWLKLTELNGQVYRVNFDHILYYVDDDGCTLVSPFNDRNDFRVKETPVQIDEMLVLVDNQKVKDDIITSLESLPKYTMDVECDIDEYTEHMHICYEETIHGEWVKVEELNELITNLKKD